MAFVDAKFVAGYISVPKLDAVEFVTVDPNDKSRVLVNPEQFQKLLENKTERSDVRK